MLLDKEIWVVERAKDTSDSNNEEEKFFVEAVVEEVSTKDEWIAYIDINRVTVPFKQDTTYQVNRLLTKDFDRLRKKPKVHDRKTSISDSHKRDHTDRKQDGLWM